MHIILCPGIFQCILIWVLGPVELGNLRHFNQFWEFSLLSSCNLQTFALYGFTLYLFVHCYKQEIVSFECQGTRQLTRKNYWKFGVLQIWKFHLLFGKIQALFPLGMGPKFGPQNNLEKSPNCLWYDVAIMTCFISNLSQ